LLRYQWPTNILPATSDMKEAEHPFARFTKAERTDVFSQKTAAEELYVRHKVKQFNPAYDVIFIPTILYELFCLYLYFQNPEPFYLLANSARQLKEYARYGESIDLQTIMVTIGRFKDKALPNAYVSMGNHAIDEWFLRPDFDDIIKKNISTKPMGDVKDPVTFQFLRLYHHEMRTCAKASFLINQKLAAFLEDKFAFDEMNEKDAKTIKQIHDDINSNVKSYLCNILVELKIAYTAWQKENELNQYFSLTQASRIASIMSRLLQEADYFSKLDTKLVNSDKTSLLSKVIDLEYKAREQNKALLFRAAGEKIIKSPDEKEQKKAAGPSVALDIPYSYSQYSTSSRADQPYSIAFGNSLLAGCLGDPGACMYWHLQPEGTPKLGYALMVDKLSYIKNNVNNLFFIAPLAPWLAIFGWGEFFHSRSKAAMNKVPDKEIAVEGFSWQLLDKSGAFIIQRNPLHQAGLLSDYIATHAHLLRMGTSGKDEKTYLENLKISQANVTSIYQKKIPTLRKKIKAFEKKLHTEPARIKTQVKKYYDVLKAKTEDKSAKTAYNVNAPLFHDLITDMQEYKTTNAEFHAGDLYEHSMWVEQIIAEWFDEKSPWCQGLEKYKNVLALAGFLHGIGKAGDRIFIFNDKPDHAQVGFDYLNGSSAYSLKNGKILDFKALFNQMHVPMSDRVLITVLTGIHLDFGLMVMRDNNLQGFLDKLTKLALSAGYGSIDETLVRMSILIGAADARGSQPSQGIKTNLFSKPRRLAPVRKTAEQIYTYFDFEKSGPLASTKLLEHFDKQPKK